MGRRMTGGMAAAGRILRAMIRAARGTEDADARLDRLERRIAALETALARHEPAAKPAAPPQRRRREDRDAEAVGSVTSAQSLARQMSPVAVRPPDVLANQGLPSMVTVTLSMVWVMLTSSNRPLDAFHFFNRKVLLSIT